jgi:AraC-like DNA-binding protein/mannose-6-phosphate isomerase-like protein (cupin superfamily)
MDIENELLEMLSQLDADELRLKRIYLAHAKAKGEIVLEVLSEKEYFSSEPSRHVFLNKHVRYTPMFVHSHTFFEFTYVCKGSCVQQFLTHKVPMKTGDFCLISPGVKHALGVFDDETLVLNILISRSTFKDIFSNFLRRDNVLSDFFLENLFTNTSEEFLVFHTDPNDSEIRNLVLNMYRESISGLKYFFLVLDSQLIVLFALLLRSYGESYERSPYSLKDSGVRDALLSYILDTSTTVTLSELAAHFHYSIPYASRLVKTLLGDTFTGVLTRIRMEKACSLLRDTNISVRDISNEVGYANVEHFTRKFKQKNGVTPLCYRNRENKG